MTRTVPHRQPSFRAAVEALSGAWPVSRVVDEAGAHIQGAVERAGGLDLNAVPLAAAPRSALTFAIVDRAGRVLEADASFARLVEDDMRAVSAAGLMRRLRKDEATVGLAESVGGGVVALCGVFPERAVSWPLSEALRAAMARPGCHAVLMGFAPARASDLGSTAAAAFGLSELEARIAVGLLEAPTLAIAAGRAGVGRETARDALSGAMRKMGVRRTPMLVRRLTDLICGSATLGGDALAGAIDLTAGETKVARLSADGASTAGVARELGVKPETVKSHLRSAFGKIGIARAKDLGRLDVQLRALQALSSAGEIVFETSDEAGRLRMIARPDGRRVAFMDYGPADGRLVLVCHALSSGRSLPPGLASGLVEAGFRPVVPQRPGFGLTDPPLGGFLEAAANDMAAIVESLRRDDADVFARDIATAAVLAFAEAHPGRVGRVVLLNPEPVLRRRRAGESQYAIPAAGRLLQRHPEIVEVFFEVLRRQTGSERLAALLKESFRSGAVSDVAALENPAVVDWLVRDIQAMVARTVTGMVRERLVYANGWRPPRALGGRWLVAACAELGVREPEAWHETLPGFRREEIAQGGLLLPITHPEVIVGLLGRRG